MPYIDDIYIYSFDEVRYLLRSYFLDEIGSFDLSEKKADVHQALLYYGLTKKDCIKTVRQKICGTVCFSYKVRYKVVRLVCEFLNGNIALLNSERAQRIAESYRAKTVKEILFADSSQ